MGRRGRGGLREVGEERRECGAREGSGGWGTGGRVNRKEERESGGGRRCQMVPWDPLLPASLPTSAVRKAGIVLLVHKPHAQGKAWCRALGIHSCGPSRVGAQPRCWSELNGHVHGKGLG